MRNSLLAVLYKRAASGNKAAAHLPLCVLSTAATTGIVQIQAKKLSSSTTQVQLSRLFLSAFVKILCRQAGAGVAKLLLSHLPSHFGAAARERGPAEWGSRVSLSEHFCSRSTS